MVISRGEFKFIVYSFLLIGVFISIPYVWGYLTAPEDLTFTGFTMGVHTMYSHTDWMNQVKEGHLLFTTNRTSENLPYLFLNTLYLLLGLLSVATGLSNITIYNLFYIVSAFIFFLILYYFIAMFFSDIKIRKTTLIITMTSSGFGFIFWIFFKAFNYTPLFFSENLPLGSRIFPIDLWLTDAISFLTLYSGYIHHVVGVIFILLTFIFLIKGWENRDSKYVLYSAIMTFVLGTFHLYDVVMIYVILTIFVFLSAYKGNIIWKLRMYVMFITVSIPPMVFNFYVFVLNPEFNRLTLADPMLSPNPYSYVLGFGLPLLLASYYIYKKVIYDIKNTDFRTLLLFSWIIGSFALAYAPIIVQRRLQLGLNIPIAILASYALFEFVLPKVKENRSNLVLASLIVLMMPTNVLWIAKETFKVNQHGYPPHEYPYYINNLDLKALDWLEENTVSSEVVFSGNQIGEVIAGRLSHRVFLGFGGMTLNYTYKEKVFEEFFNANDERRMEILRYANASYFYYGAEEAEMTNFDPEAASYLKKVFENPRVRIYKVV